MSTLKPYSGPSRQLVLSFDVGTTFSGMSYCILDPGQIPKIYNITRYPGQEHASGSSKIPTVLYYDQDGRVKAAGAEALLDANVETAEDEEWLKVEWFKVLMRPKSMPMALRTSTLPPLPPNKTVTQVFADFLEYLLSCAQKFICDTHATFSQSWHLLYQNAVFVIGHPNGWEGAQQSKLRQAAIIAKMILDTPEGRARVKFVTEGEASLQYCLPGGLIDTNQGGFIVADLGGGTLDFSAYKLKGTKPLRVEEAVAARCELEGSTFVTQRAKVFLKEKLQHSAYGADHLIKLISERFDETTKKVFRNSNDTCLVTFGTTLDRDPGHGIRGGKLKLSGQDVASLFEPAVEATMTAILNQFRNASTTINTVYLVGGFSASPYLVTQLKERLALHNISISTPDGQTSKAVADGALLFYIENFVSSRVAKASYCVEGDPPYNPSNPQHVQRSHHVYTNPSGYENVHGGLFTVLRKGTSVSKETEFRKDFGHDVLSISSIKSEKIALKIFVGQGFPPKWTDQLRDRSLLKDLCHVGADVSTLRNILQPLNGPSGTKFWRVDFAVVLKFGGPELIAQIAWDENGIERRGPAQIVYDEEGQDNGEDDSGSETDLTPAIGRLVL